MRKPMRAIAELLVLDEPVRPDAPTSLTSPETGLTGRPAENSESAATFYSKGKAEVADWRVPIVTYLKVPLGTKSNKFSKWSPSWEGPYKIVKVIFGNSYMVETLQGERLPRALNGRYLKKYYPSVWQDA